jgi:hypothetical protein
MRKNAKIARVRRDLEDVRRKRRAEQTDYWFRCVGYATRPLVYFGPMVLLIWWLWPHAVTPSQAPNSLALTELLLIGGCIFGFFAVVIPLILFFLNVDGDEINWEAWGRFGEGLGAVLISAGVWLALM